MRIATRTAQTADGFAAIVRRHQAMVFSIAWRFLHDRNLAEELAQEVFLQLFQALDGLETDEHIAHWLRRTAVHRCIDAVRRNRLRPQVGLEDAPEPATPAADDDPLLRRTLAALVASLPEKARMVVILRYQEDLDPSDIAGMLDMPVRTVKSHLQRSLALLREKLSRRMSATDRAGRSMADWLAAGIDPRTPGGQEMKAV